jgi:predicted ATP-dependent serine protease
MGGAFKHSSDVFQRFCKALDVNARPKPVLSDLEKLQQIEVQVRKEERKQVAAFSGSHWLYTGAPGTGKTFRLLKIAHQHALEGCKVLFACFNKVLAADITRSIPTLANQDS